MPNLLPVALLQSLTNVPGFNRESFVQVHQSGEQITSIRYNPLKSSITAYTGEPVPWCVHGRYLEKRPSFTFDPLFHAGVYYVQEASSMFLWHALQQIQDNSSTALKVLDLCAAPGGKTTLLSAYFTDGLVVANEVIKTRASVLTENTTKWGASNVVVTNNDPSAFGSLEGFFDVIVADAPCSGSGLFRKDPAAIEEWSEDNVQLCSQRQQRILADILPALKPDGVLIYSTCSYSPQEDEVVCDWLMQTSTLESIDLHPSPEWNITEVSSPQHQAHGYRFYPNHLKGEGFFIAAFRKTTGSCMPYRKQNMVQASKSEITVVQEWIKQESPLSFIKQKDTLLALPAQWEQDIALLQKHLYLRKAGVAIGELKHTSLVPHHELALSLLVSNALPKLNLDKEQAIQYLQKKELHLDIVSKGFTMAVFENTNLGWMKILPNRVNNYYPTEWRILKD